MPARLLFLLLLASAATAIAGAPSACPPDDPPDATSASGHYLAAARCRHEAGEQGRALLVVERLLALDPQNAEGLALREAILARMKTVRPREAPANLGYAFDSAQRRRLLELEPRRARLWIAIEAGYDSNINSGTDSTEISIPLLRGTTVALDDDLALLRGRSSPFVGANAGFEAGRVLGASTQARVSGLAAVRVNTDELEFVPHNYQLAAELDHRRGPARFALGLAYTNQLLALKRAVGILAPYLQVDVSAGADHVLSIFAEQANKDMPEFKELRTRQVQQGVAWTHLPSRLRVALYTGRERGKGAIQDLDRDFDGLAVAWERRLSATGWLSMTYLESRSHYSKESPLFLVKREETLRELTVAYERTLSRAWYLTPRVIVQENDSNIELTRFSRTQWLIELRREF